MLPDNLTEEDAKELIEALLGGLMNIQVLIRWVLTIALLYGIYTETGIWTTIAFFLVFLRVELEGIMI